MKKPTVLSVLPSSEQVLVAIVRMGQAGSLSNVLEELCNAAESLLKDASCSVPRAEEIAFARDAGRKILEVMHDPGIAGVLAEFAEFSEFSSTPLLAESDPHPLKGP